MNGLVLSIFPGIDILGKGFEAEGYCVVRGPDLLWGGDVRGFHPPAGVFEGVIGGPPCQVFSRLRYVNPLAGAKTGNLIPEFERCVSEAAPKWFLMENVREAPIPVVEGYVVDPTILNNRWIGEVQNRAHRLSFGSLDGSRLSYEVSIFESLLYEPRICASDARRTPVKLLAGSQLRRGTPDARPPRTIHEACELQGLPPTMFDDGPFLQKAKLAMLGNAVPLPMARALAKAVRQATGHESNGHR